MRSILISRQLILDQLIHHGLQDLLPYFILNYGQPSELSVQMANGSTQWFQSREGVRQGDPLAPFFFALGLQTVLSHLWDELGSPGIADTILEPLADEVESHTRAECWDRKSQRAVVDPSALLDDISFVGPWPTVLYAAHRLQQLIIRLHTGLEFNLRKCAAWSRSLELDEPFSNLGEGGQRISFPVDGITLLGAPIGPGHHEEDVARSIVAKHTTLLERLPSLPSLQRALLLLRFCAAQRFTYLMRTVPPSSLVTAAAEHDQQVRACLATLLTEDTIPDDIWLQSTLRLSEGGLGLGSATRNCHAAFLGAAGTTMHGFASSFPAISHFADLWKSPTTDCSMAANLRHSMTYLNSLAEYHSTQGTLPADSLVRTLPRSLAELPEVSYQLQHHVTSMDNCRTKDALMQRLPLIAKAQLRSQSGPGACGFLCAVPFCPSIAYPMQTC